MNANLPQFQDFLTAAPHSIGEDQTLHTARELMKKHAIRHLPVLRAGALVGILSDRDVETASGMASVDPERTEIKEIATEDVYLVKPESSLEEVVRNMRERKIGSAAVVSDHRLVGIFTTTDALRALESILSQMKSQR